MTALYRLLLFAFPRRVRRDFGDEMLRLFEAQLATVREAGDSVARLWLQAIADAAVHGVAERIESAGRRVRAIAGAAKQWRNAMYAWRYDVRHAIRTIGRQPGVTALAVFTLALGIGANTAIFSAVDSVLLRPLPWDDPERLVMVWEKRAAEGVFNNTVAPADFVDWARMNTSFASMAAQSSTSADLTGSGEPTRLVVGTATPRFFDVFRVQPQFGRTFRSSDGVVGSHRVIVLGHRLWQRQFGADPSVVGRAVQLNGIAHEIIGVLPQTFEFPDPTLELWAPIPYEGVSQPLNRASHELYVYARLKSGVSFEQARSEMDRIGGQLEVQYAFTNRGHGAFVASLREELVGTVRPVLLILLGAVAFVLLIACVNVASLLLARAAGRRREMAIRAALGAGRTRLAGQLFTESLVLGLIGGAAGLFVAWGAIRAIGGLVPDDAPVPGLARMGLDLRVLGFAVGISLFTSVLFGLLPAWQLAGADPNVALQEAGARQVGGVRRRLRLVLVVSEIALASLLLVGAGLALRSFAALLSVPAGFVAEGRQTLPVVLRNLRYRDDATTLAAYQQIEQRFAAIPGVHAVGATTHVPLSGADSRRGIVVEGREPAPDEPPTRAHPRAVSPGYFRALGLQFVEGRAFADTDGVTAPRVIIVNETMARRYWPGGSPIGKRVAFSFLKDPQWREVVGVVRDVRHWGFARPVNPEMYMPVTQYPVSSLSFVLVTPTDAAGLAGPLREALTAIDPNLPLATIRSMEEVTARSVVTQRGVMLLLGMFAGVALLLATAGIYGVMAHLVTLRTGEIGIRLALGARPAAVLRGVLAEGAWQAVVGLAIGLAGAVAVVRVFRRLLYGVEPADPLTLAVVALLMLAAALVACLVPARRAMRVDPVAALRQ